MKNNVFHLINGLGLGGTEIQLSKLLPILQSEYENIVICLFTKDELEERLVSRGIKVYYLQFDKNFIKSIFIFRNLINIYKPKFMITYLIHADLYGRLFGKVFGIKKIFCSQRGSLLNWEFLRIIDRITKYLVDMYIVQTKVARCELSNKLNLPNNKFFVLPNGIEIKKETKDKVIKPHKLKELGIKNLLYKNIICVSNLREGKGHEYLIDAFNELDHDEINLLFVGDGEKAEKLKNLVFEKKISNIYFLGKRDDVIEILKICDIFVLPTLAEGMSNAILEAMSVGMPVIVSDIEVNAELIEDKVSGLLFKVKDAIDLKDKLELIIKDEVLAKKLADEAKTRALTRFEISVVAKKLLIFLKEQSE